MSIGRQDYQGGVVPSKSGYGYAQTNFFKYQNVILGSGVTGTFCAYTPAAGYQLNVCGFRIATLMPFIHTMFLRVGGAIQFSRAFDTEIMDNFPEGSTLTVAAGQEVQITVKNEDAVTDWFYVAVYGYLEQVIS